MKGLERKNILVLKIHHSFEIFSFNHSLGFSVHPRGKDRSKRVALLQSVTPPSFNL